MRVDPAQFAVRGDLADVELADRVFAPHYAAAVPYRILRETAILAEARGDAEIRGTVAAGGYFHVLDISGGWAWGHGDAARSVGYIAADVLSPR